MGHWPDEEELTRAAKAVLKGEHVKIFTKCDNCTAMEELPHGNSRPDTWIAADIEAPAGRVSLILCPGCGEDKLGPLLPKPPPKGSAANAGQP